MMKIETCYACNGNHTRCLAVTAGEGEMEKVIIAAVVGGVAGAALFGCPLLGALAGAVIWMKAG